MRRAHPWRRERGRVQVDLQYAMKVSHEETWLAPSQGKVIEIQTKWGAQFKGYLRVLRVSANQSVYKACEEKQRAG